MATNQPAVMKPSTVVQPLKPLFDVWEASNNGNMDEERKSINRVYNKQSSRNKSLYFFVSYNEAACLGGVLDEPLLAIARSW